MKRTLPPALAGALGAGLLGLLIGCDGSSGSTQKVQAKPPLPEGQKIEAPRPPDIGGASAMDKPKEG